MKKYVSFFCIFGYLFVFSQDIASEAERAFQLAEYDVAFGLFKEATEQHIEKNEPVAYIHCNLMMAECKIQMGEPNEGNQIAANTLEYLQKYFPEQRLVIGQAMTVQGRSYLNLGRADLALQYLTEAEKLLGTEETLELANCYNQIGIAHLNNYNFELTLQYLESALKIRRKLLKITDREIGDSFNNLGHYHLAVNNPLQAIVYYNRAKKNL